MASLRSAIDAMCRACIHDPGSGNGAWREQVSACSSSNCPLHPVRPQTGRKASRGAPIARSVANDSGAAAPAKTRTLIGQIGGVA